ncbi:hypothetical protein BS47DRAFT_1360443 [Hydnum rufescens UP504]|uniref:Uncharacterized protein n=1 Tax=Hydnum rufescens UP504 TaxID=1448309 RepID=A0A9P6B3F7_9AGAM|nr:hypothetical protein BS47DRAFT_1360443 [Hydnum rufescens UP504]
MSGLSQDKIEKFFDLTWTHTHQNLLSFGTAKKMYELIEKLMLRGLGWKTTTIMLEDAPTEPQTLYYQDIIDCVEYLIGNPTFNEFMMYRPIQVLKANGKTHIYHEMTTGDLWNELQRSLPRGMTILGVILCLDETYLTNFSGDTSVHTVYMMLSNIRSSTCRKVSEGAWMMLAKIPTSKFLETTFPTKAENACQGFYSNSCFISACKLS